MKPGCGGTISATTRSRSVISTVSPREARLRRRSASGKFSRDGAPYRCRGHRREIHRSGGFKYDNGLEKGIMHEYDYSSHGWNSVMRKIQLKDAKARLSAVVDAAVRGQAAVITRHGKPEAVVLSFREWQRLAKVPTFGRLLMSAPIKAADLPRRNRSPLRRVSV
jgi:antitoxin Phd